MDIESNLKLRLELKKSKLNLYDELIKALSAFIDQPNGISTDTLIADSFRLHLLHLLPLPEYNIEKR